MPESIIISKRLLREADLLVTFFSVEHGKVKGVAHNAKKSMKRFGGGLESGYVVDLQYSAPSKSDLVNIEQAVLVSPRLSGYQTLASSSALWLALEFASRFLPELEEGRKKYELLRRFVTAIHEGRLTRQIMLFFLIQWIGLSGYMPDFNDGDIEYRFKHGSVEAIKKIIAGNIEHKLDDAIFGDILGFIFSYSASILGRPLKLEAYLPMLMEL